MSEPAFAVGGPARDAHRFDETRLAERMAADVDEFAGSLVIELSKGNWSDRTLPRDHALRLVADLRCIADLGWQQAVRAGTSRRMGNV